MAIQDDLQNIKKWIKTQEEIKDKKKKKEWKFPFGKKVSKAQKKKNYVTVLIIYENNFYEFKKYQIDEQTILHDAVPRLAASGHVIYDKKGNPLIVLPNWSVEPFSPLEHYEKSLINGSNKNGFKLLMNKMRLETVNPKKQISGIVKWIFGLGFLGLIIYAAMTGGG